jgi:hypothetical protein
MPVPFEIGLDGWLRNRSTRPCRWWVASLAIGALRLDAIEKFQDRCAACAGEFGWRKANECHVTPPAECALA